MNDTTVFAFYHTELVFLLNFKLDFALNGVLGITDLFDLIITELIVVNARFLLI